ncbi:hypothetical protein N7475_007257 [Penicillium sp. IBT 31633x]|nr:hypothetical protein N7475_007257 [Penicillium sp. IBT 31633x]
MAEYAFWLQHEHSRTSAPIKDGWYERRLSWFSELVNIMQVSVQEIVKMVKEMRVTERKSEEIDRNGISDQFSASVRRDLGRHPNSNA